MTITVDIGLSGPVVVSIPLAGEITPDEPKWKPAKECTPDDLDRIVLNSRGEEMPLVLNPLRRDWWTFRRYGADRVCVGMHLSVPGIAIHHTMFNLSDLPNKYLGRDDLERILALPIDVPAV